MNMRALRLCLVTHLQNTPFATYKDFIIQAIKGGVTSIQLRLKAKPDDEILSIGSFLKTLLDEYNIPLIINDHAHIAKELGAHLHIGPHDISPLAARELLGEDAIIGLSIETLAELAWANQLTCINYVAASAVFPSQTKLDCKTYWGIDGLKNVVAHSMHPVVGIGGIEVENIEAVMSTGVSGVAVVGAIHRAEDPSAMANKLITTIDRCLEKQ